MKVYYDDKIDALYLSLSEQSPDGAIEIAAGVSLDTARDGKIIGIEILEASEKIDISTIFSYTLDLDPGLFRNRAA